MTTAMMTPILGAIDRAGYSYVNILGGAVFDVCVRYLQENPWERIGLLCIPRRVIRVLAPIAQCPAHFRRVGLGPPTIELREIDGAVDQSLHSARAASFPRTPRRVEP